TYLAQAVRRFELIVSRHRAYPNLTALFADVGEVFNAADVDENLRSRQPELHRRNQAVPTREDLRFVGVFSPKRNRFGERRRSKIIKLCWNHFLTSYLILIQLSMAKTESLTLRAHNSPDGFRSDRHIDMSNAERRQRVNDGIHDRRRGT